MELRLTRVKCIIKIWMGGVYWREGNTDSRAEQLREACRMTSARWAAVLDRSGESWQVTVGTGLVKKQLKCLAEYLLMPEVCTWISGAAAVGRNRWRKLPDRLSLLGSVRIYLFPIWGGEAAVLVGADLLAKDNSAWWRVISLGIAANRSRKDTRPKVERAGRQDQDHVKQIGQFALSIAAVNGPHERARAASQEIARIFGATTVSILLEHDGNGHSVVYDASKLEATELLEPPMPLSSVPITGEREPKLLMLGLVQCKKSIGYLMIQSSKIINTEENRLLAEVYANILSGMLLEPAELSAEHG
jgi:hypothetical protein